MEVNEMILVTAVAFHRTMHRGVLPRRQRRRPDERADSQREEEATRLSAEHAPRPFHPCGEAEETDEQRSKEQGRRKVAKQHAGIREDAKEPVPGPARFGIRAETVE